MSNGRGEEGMRNSEVTVGVLIPSPTPSYRSEQSVKPVIDRRKASAKFDGIAPSAWRDFQIRKSAVIWGGSPRRGLSVGGRALN